MTRIRLHFMRIANRALRERNIDSSLSALRCPRWRIPLSRVLRRSWSSAVVELDTRNILCADSVWSRIHGRVFTRGGLHCGPTLETRW